MSQLPGIYPISYEVSAGIYELFYPLPDNAFDPLLTAPFPITDLTGYGAVGAVLDKCGGTVLQALSGSQAAQGLTDSLKFVVNTITESMAQDNGENLTRTFTNTHGLEFTLRPVPATATYYYINLVAPGGRPIPLVKGDISNGTCDTGACC